MVTTAAEWHTPGWAMTNGALPESNEPGLLLHYARLILQFSGSSAPAVGFTGDGTATATASVG